MRTFQLFSGAALTALLIACGGAAKSGGGSKSLGVPPPPPNVKKQDDEPKREISKDEKQDYGAAIELFTKTDKSGWNESACRQSAERFEQVARTHKSLVEAYFMTGLSYERCNMTSDAEKAYQAAIRVKPNHGQSLSNLGQIYYKAGKVDGAKQYWKSALDANGKLVAARVNLASMYLDQMRKLPAFSGEWKKLEEEAKFELSSSLGVDTENVAAYTVYGLVFMEGWQKNKNRLDLAKLLLDEGKKRNEKYAPLQNAYGLLYLHKNALSEALKHFQAAVELDPKFAEARMNVGLITLAFRKYDTAKESFSAALELQPKNYDAIVGLGAAMRGLKDYDGAEAQYKKAAQLDGRRGEAFYNLAVLYKDFRATKQEAQESIATYKQAKDYFRQFLDKQAKNEDKQEAKEQIALIDKTVTQTEKFLKMLASQPKEPTPAPAPAPAPAPKQ